MLSNRTARPETWNSGENRQGYFQGDGFLTVLVDAQEFGKPKAEIFQVYDWARLPGVTNLYTKDIPTYQRNTHNAEHFFNDEKFVGGVSDGLVGVSAMVYSRPTVALYARKSWFFLGGIIIALGTDITLPEDEVTNQTVITTLSQEVYGGVGYTIGMNRYETVGLGLEDHRNVESYVTEQPLWLHHHNVGYVFLSGNQLLHTNAQHKTVNNKKFIIFSAWLDHGSFPTNGSYAYAVLPAKTQQWTADFAVDRNVHILMQTTQVHAVCYDIAQVTGITFYSAESLLFTCGNSGLMEVSVNLPCLVLIKVKRYKKDYAKIKITIADPQQLYNIISLQVVWGNEQSVLNVNLPQHPNRGASVSHTLTFSSSPYRVS
ncbi:unnamed protein product [Meganyctiphanes norvegica]|uniref:Uncharacterized protein n=1 Tax=Meganyctiphanes norvegica TaxID=48144 RepID=A0AAV2S7V6_MEGNR